MPPKTGDKIKTRQSRPICPTESMQRNPTPFNVAMHNALPTIPPIMACVVETGKAFMRCKSSHNAAAKSAEHHNKDKLHRIQNASHSNRQYRLRMVSVTSPPAITAPLTSNTAAISKACEWSMPEPTLVPKELAISLPPH